MKLNLWMIANRLYELEPELHIPIDAPVSLKSARRAYADNCVYVYQSGNDVICDAGEDGGHIIFREAKCDQIFELVQFTFDYYNDWQEDILSCVDRLDYHKLIQHCWHIFHNPILLMDQRSRLLAYSEQYKDDSINYDWDYLLQNRESAVSVIQFLMKTGRGEDFYTNDHARIFNFPQNPYVNTEISVLIYNDLDVAGRLNIIEYERPLNKGDCILADMIVRFLKQIFSQMSSTQMNNRVLYPVLNKLLKNEAITELERAYWKEITNWTSSNLYQVVILEVPAESNDIRSMLLLCNLIQNAVPDCIATEVDGRIAFIYKIQIKEYSLSVLLKDIVKRFNLIAGYSLAFTEIHSLHYYYDQALFALKLGKRKNPDCTFFDFYNYALEYIVVSDSLDKKEKAIHPDIWRIQKDGGKKSREMLETLRTYLEQERSPGRSADILFIHKNTFLYRINKVLSKLSCDLDDNYNRDYLKLSIIVFSLLD